MSVIRDRAAAALWGLFMGDALASPVHWYYDRSRIGIDYGSLTRYEAPKLHLPGSILNLSSTSSGGRGSDSGSIIGDVINHGKRQYWLRGGNYHYHCTLQRGENTLEAQLARLLLRHVASRPERCYERASHLELFRDFMTTPGSHNDTYASTYLRMFFANVVRGLPLAECADNDGHNVDAIDALTCLGPVVVTSLQRDVDTRAVIDAPASTAEWHAVETSVEQYLRALRRSDQLPFYGSLYASMLYRLLRRASAPEAAAAAAAAASGGGDHDANADAAHALRQQCLEAATQLGFDLQKAVARQYHSEDPMCACYMSSAFPAMLVFAYKYADSPEACLLASANAGGENVARGSALGSLLGAAYGKRGFSQWMYDGLLDREAIEAEIEAAL